MEHQALLVAVLGLVVHPQANGALDASVRHAARVRPVRCRDKGEIEVHRALRRDDVAAARARTHTIACSEESIRSRTGRSCWVNLSREGGNTHGFVLRKVYA